jgi:hypothetical protein
MCFSPDPLLRLGHGPFDPGSVLVTLTLTLIRCGRSARNVSKSYGANAKTAAMLCVQSNTATHFPHPLEPAFSAVQLVDHTSAWARLPKPSHF